MAQRIAMPTCTCSHDACMRPALSSRRLSVPDLHTYDYAIVRVVPRVERGEFVNAGVIVCCAPQNYLRALIDLDETRLRALDAAVDLDTIRDALAAIPAVCAGGQQAGALGNLSL